MSSKRYDRQTSFFGEKGQQLIQKSNVAVVGAGGLGSHVLQQLAFLGVSKILVIDPDVFEETNLNRLIGSYPDDIEKTTKKVDIASRLVKSINPNIDVTTIPENLIHKKSFSALKKASCVFGCVDNDGARLVLNELCSAFEIPYFDIASEIDNNATLAYGGRIFINTDNRGCLYCYDLISTTEAREFLLSPKDRKSEETIYGVPKTELDRAGPSVVSINGVIASLAVTEFIAMVVSLRPPNRFLQYHGHSGIVTKNIDKPISDCYYCIKVRGLGEKAEVNRYWRDML
jgi:hypothetical protein